MDVKWTGSNLLRRSQGQSLIEVLVAIALIAIAMTCLASSQTSAMGFTSHASFRSAAVLSASHMAERMRANPNGVSLGAYDTDKKFVSTANKCRSRDSGCSVSEAAAVDILEWSNYIARNLPAGTGRIDTITRGTSRKYSITVGWLVNNNSNPAFGSKKHQCGLEIARIHCYRLEFTL